MITKEEREEIQNNINILENRLKELNDRAPNGARKEKDKINKSIQDLRNSLVEKERIKKETEKLSPEDKKKKKQEHEIAVNIAKMQQLGINKGTH